MSDRLLVFGDDGSAEADVAWLWINCQRWDGWRIVVAQAQPSPPGPPLTADRAELHSWSPPCPRRPFAEAQLHSCTYLTAEADPRVVLTAPADLLVIGPRGTGLLKALHLGSTAEWLVTHPPGPLVIARHGRPVRHVVVGVDGSAHAEHAARTFASLPLVRGADVTVLAVDDGRTDTVTATTAAVELLSSAGAIVTPRIVTGRPTAALLEAIATDHADLVVLGTRGLTGLERLRVGSTAGAVTRAAPCSVLIAVEE